MRMAALSAWPTLRERRAWGLFVDERTLTRSLLPAPKLPTNLVKTRERATSSQPGWGSWALSPVSQRRRSELLPCREHAARCRKTVVIHATHRERNRRSAPCQLTPADISNGLFIRWSGVRFPSGPPSLVPQLDHAVSTPPAIDESGVTVHGNVLSVVVHVTAGRLPVSWTERSHRTAGAPGRGSSRRASVRQPPGSRSTSDTRPGMAPGSRVAFFPALLTNS